MISRVVLASLPCTVGCYCVTNVDGEKICVLNSRHSRERNVETFRYEIKHINDFGNIKVALLEKLRHK